MASSIFVVEVATEEGSAAAIGFPAASLIIVIS